MKKLLVLMLVVGMASAANAAVVLSVNGDTTVDEITIEVSTTIVIDLYNTDGSDYEVYPSFSPFIAAPDGAYELLDPRLTTLAGDMASISDPYYYDIYEEFTVILADSGVAGTTPGSQMEIDFHCLLADVDVLVELWDAADLSAPVDSLIIHQIIPEPMTVALLGLGGLALLRRRK